MHIHTRGSYNPDELWAKEPPTWWPADHPWPPRRGGMSVRGVSRIMLAIAAIALAGIVAIMVTWHGVAFGGLVRLLAVAGLGFFLVGGTLMFVGARKFGGPIMELVRAVERVEAGDYSVRVTERRWGPRPVQHLIRTFNAATARLEVDEDQRRRLLANTSHELRTPLTVMQGELEAMLDGVHPADEAHLSLALDQTRQMARLIEDLRTLALAEAGTLELHPEPTDLGALARDVAAAFAAVADRGDVRIEVEAGDEVVCDVDPVRIRQVVDNLVANAVRYAPPASAVTLAVGAHLTEVTLRVTDRGPGIAADLLPHLFDRFRKSDESRGSGLGLAIARELVEAHGGRIAATSRPGAGATFEVKIPRER